MIYSVRAKIKNKINQSFLSDLKCSIQYTPVLQSHLAVSDTDEGRHFSPLLNVQVFFFSNLTLFPTDEQRSHAVLTRMDTDMDKVTCSSL